jgi:hypothetical protein
MKRNLSGIYFRHGKENICFEELPIEKQDEILSKENDKWKNSLILMLSETINRIGNDLDLQISLTEYPEK